jgi:hypothetical protein
MTVEEEAKLQEKLKRAQKLSKEIKTIERIFEPNTEILVNLYVGSKGGSAMCSVNMNKELKEEVESAILIALEARLIDLREEYKKL